MDPLRINFLTAQGRVSVFYDISSYLTDNFFDIVWGCRFPGNPPKINFLNGLT